MFSCQNGTSGKRSRRRVKSDNDRWATSITDKLRTNGGRVTRVGNIGGKWKIVRRDIWSKTK